MLKRLLQNVLLMAFGKNPHRHAPDVFDVMFDQPHLTLRQADWQVNGRRYILRGVIYLVIATGLIVVFVSLYCF